MTTKLEKSLPYLSWLKQQTEYPKLYWNSTTPIACAGQTDRGDRQFSVFDFETLKPTTWYPQDFCHLAPSSTLELTLPKPLLRIDTPNYNSYCDLFAKNPLPKLLLGRATTLHFPEPIDPFALAACIFPQTAGTTHFFVQLNANHTFLGATPERLYSRYGRQVEVDAIAGTAPIDSDRDLLLSTKDLDEWRHVHDFIDEKLSTLCFEHATQETPSLLRSANVHHLYTHFSGTLKPEVTDDLLIHTLHPTPAVCGTPQKQARLFLEALEPFKRGYFAAPIGWSNKEGAEYCVAIRSAEIIDERLILYAAAGIVDGSTPKNEWEELNLKIAPWINLFS